MNNKAQVGKILGHLYASAFLVAIFILFIILFNIIPGSVTSSVTDQGTFFAEQVLAQSMNKEFVFDEETLTLQQALNNKKTRTEAGKILFNEIAGVLKSANQKAVIAIYDEEEEIWGDFVNDEAEFSMTDFSTACWPYLEGDSIKHIRVFVGDNRFAIGFNKRFIC